MPALPKRFDDVEALESFMSEASPALVADLEKVDGDVMVLGVGGKMGPTLARMARRAAPGRRVIGVARFSDPALAASLERHGVECIACDLLDRQALARLPNVDSGVRNLVFMAGHKFGAADNASLTWMMNVGVPMMVAETFREMRIVAFSTACVYPFVPVNGPGADERTPATPPAGDYANSCVGRERMFEYGSRRYGTPGRLVRLSYAIDTRYGVLFDVGSAVFDGAPLDLTMGYANVIWQGDANEQSLRLLAHCTNPTSPVNVTGPEHTSIRWLAGEFGKRFGRKPVLVGEEAPTAWLEDTTESQRLFGKPRVPIDAMIDWVADWIERGQPGLGKPTHFSTRDGKY
ncbi:MAG: NAD(P)-dependent oxidoreductase [Lautropia sp.]|nr:MAG: NAD(P)-dependent oxidoreductase [Pseudomonadota bacterium]MBC6959722.1 NAD(P)-dependent oxidoreductase [Lautropia sp.]MCL4701610.1 NAD(P)-dependent oxidoreductase [Burkholderiaceae bacterium]MDL1906170.1 NAD(P)-dependent oxidoreductase [Betaproteobacteria bacterium PRO1]RIK91491.1 MAG: epimerase [Burkholderiales bacterium]